MLGLLNDPSQSKQHVGHTMQLELGIIINSVIGYKHVAYCGHFLLHRQFDHWIESFWHLFLITNLATYHSPYIWRHATEDFSRCRALIIKNYMSTLANSNEKQMLSLLFMKSM